MTVRRTLTAFVASLLCLMLIARAGAEKWKSSRPRLLFDQARISRFRQQITEEGPVRDGWLKLLSRADRLLDAKFVSE
jgi:hypothetical protein